MYKHLVSVVLPVYNRIEYLGIAIESVLNQTYEDWELIIADDCSDSLTYEFLSKFQSLDSRIKIYRNLKNEGLFPNLNQALRNYCQGDYILLLCSDDYLYPNCLDTYVGTAQMYPHSHLILSPLDVVNSDGHPQPSPADIYYEQFSSKTQLLQPQEVVPLLLKYGSINGNLTGMFFKRNLIDIIGTFREDWQHAADWEWVYRAGKNTGILICRIKIGAVRVHDTQLSNSNFKDLSNSLEVCDMVKILLDDSLMMNVKTSQKWALHILQFQLWYALKALIKGDWVRALILLKKVHNTTGLLPTLWRMLCWLPDRWIVYKTKSFPNSPS